MIRTALVGVRGRVFLSARPTLRGGSEAILGGFGWPSVQNFIFFREEKVSKSWVGGCPKAPPALPRWARKTLVRGIRNRTGAGTVTGTRAGSWTGAGGQGIGTGKTRARPATLHGTVMQSSIRNHTRLPRFARVLTHRPSAGAARRHPTPAAHLGCVALRARLCWPKTTVT